MQITQPTENGTPSQKRKPKALAPSVEERLNPLLKLRMEQLGITNIVELSKRCSLGWSTLYGGLLGRSELTIRNARKVAAALGFPWDLFCKIYLSEDLSEIDLHMLSQLCNIPIADVWKLHVNATKNLCSFYCQPEMSA